jgi:hypothetical protein
MKLFKALVTRFVIVGLLAAAVGFGAPRTADAQSLTDPQANVVGTFSVDSSGALTVDGFVSLTRYLDGSSKLINDAEETIIGASVTLSGSSFVEVDLFGNFVYSPGTLTVASGSSVYLTASVDPVLIENTTAVVGTINPDVSLNMGITSTDTTLGSRFISEFQAALDGVPTTDAAVRLELTIIGEGSFDGQAAGNVLGVIDGAPAPTEPPGEPRTIGFWKNTYQGRGKGSMLYDAVTREALAAIAVSRTAVFDSVNDDGDTHVDDLLPALTSGGKRPMLVQAQQQLAALLLNLAAGLLEETTPIDLTALTSATTVGGAVDEIADILTNPLSTDEDVERAKDIADNINNGQGVG